MAADKRTEDRFAKNRGPRALLLSHWRYTLALSRKHLPVRSDVVRAGTTRRGHTYIEGRLRSHAPDRALRPTAAVAGEGPSEGRKTRLFSRLRVEISRVGGGVLVAAC